MFKKILRVTTPYWKSEDRWRGLALLTASIFFSLGIVYCTYLLTNWSQQFYDSIQRMDIPAFFQAMKRFAVLVIAILTTFVCQYYFSQLLILRWRKWLTHHAIQRWLEHGNYYFHQHIKQKTDNPDQRIAEDTGAFVDRTVSLLLECIRNLVSLVTFSLLLWKLSGDYTFFGIKIPGFMLWACILYAFLGTIFAHLIGKKIAPLNFKNQSLEADFRFHLVRVRENAESILLMNGNEAEKNRLRTSFRAVLKNALALVNEQKKLVLFTNLFSNFSSIFPIVVAAPRYFAKKLTMGQLMQTSAIFGQVRSSLSFVIDSYTTIAYWLSIVERLDGFFQAMEQSEELCAGTEQKFANPDNGGELAAEDLLIHFPEVRDRVASLNFKLSPGSSLLVSGPSGVGKSTLLRIFCKLWPHFTGKISVPAHRPLVIPQRPYLPIGTLKSSVTYPETAEKYSDAEILELLELCQLPQLKSLLQETAHWSQILSLGEQQRLAWARVFLHRPSWLLLDEATASLDTETQSILYRELSIRLPQTTVVSVAHRGELKEFHSRELRVEYGKA